MWKQVLPMVLFFSTISCPSVSFARVSRPGPSLRVYVYDQQGRPLHGAKVSVRDRWAGVPNPKQARRETKADGSCLFPSRDFYGWFIYLGRHGGRSYSGDDPWNWEAFPPEIVGSTSGSISRVPNVRRNQIEEFPKREGEYSETIVEPAVKAVFKVLVEVDMEGFESNSRSVDFSLPNQEVALRLSRTESERTIRVVQEDTSTEKYTPSTYGTVRERETTPVQVPANVDSGGKTISVSREQMLLFIALGGAGVLAGIAIALVVLSISRR